MTAPPRERSTWRPDRRPDARSPFCSGVPSTRRTPRRLLGPASLPRSLPCAHRFILARPCAAPSVAGRTIRCHLAASGRAREMGSPARWKRRTRWSAWRQLAHGRHPTAPRYPGHGQALSPIAPPTSSRSEITRGSGRARCQTTIPPVLQPRRQAKRRLPGSAPHSFPPANENLNAVDHNTRGHPERGPLSGPGASRQQRHSSS